MRKKFLCTSRLVLAASITICLAGMLATSSAFGQAKEIRHERHPAAFPAVTATPQTQPTYEYFSILNGTPQGLTLHHDTEVGTGKAVDVYVFPIELQVMNSDGDLEPEGLIIDNFFTANAVDANTAPNPNNGHDCKTWNALVISEMQNRSPKSPTWSYVEFTVAQGARVLQTNEDGQVFWSDDVECWGSRDRFSPF
jgi:hypothetical protein